VQIKAVSQTSFLLIFYLYNAKEKLPSLTERMLIHNNSYAKVLNLSANKSLIVMRTAMFGKDAKKSIT